MKRSTDRNYGQVHIRNLRAGILEAIRTGNHKALVTAAGEAVTFLNRRLTDAARAGCHHCDEGEPGTPCRWCGLKVNRRL